MKKESGWFQNLSIKKKLLVSHGIIITLAAMITIFLLLGMWEIRGKVVGIYTGPLTNIDNIGNVRYGLSDLQRAINRLMLEGADAVDGGWLAFETTMESDVSLVVESMSVLEDTLSKDEGKEKLKEMQAKVEEGESIRPQVVELLKSGNFDEAYTMNYETYLPVVNEIKSIAQELETIIYNAAEEYYQTANQTSMVLVFSGIVIVLLGTIIGLAVAAMVTRAIVTPVKEIVSVSQRLYAGEMSAGRDISYSSMDEIGNLADSLRGAMANLEDYIIEISDNLRQMAQGDLTKDGDKITDFLGDFASIKESFVYILKRFNSTLLDIQNASDQVASSSTEIAGAAQALAEGTTDQASAIEQLTTTVSTVATLAEESAKKTQTAYDNIQQSTDQAEQEKKKMEELTEEMKHIMDISKEIENIIATIEDIASQTNLLSLNASIEAARAGEAGKGFAVVADQIGKLASDSAQSAVNTRELIVKTLEEIEKGNVITASTSVAFEKVIDDMREFALVAQDTNETAKSQAAALDQVERGIEEISSVVQNTSSASEESAAISEKLSEKADELDTLVKRFKLYNL